MVIDAWMQHPTLRFLAHDMFDSLRRWTGHAMLPERGARRSTLTVAAMDAAGVDFGLLSAWHAPRAGALISNDEVAGWVAAHPDRFAGARGRRPRPSRWTAVRELRRCVTELGFKGLRVAAVAVGGAADRPALLPAVRGVRRARRAVLHAGRPHRPAAPVGDRAADPVHRPGRDRLPRARDRRRPHRLPVDRGDGRGRAQARERRTSTRRAYTTRRYPPELVAYMQDARRARARCCSARNYPMIAPERALAASRSSGSTTRRASCTSSGNARRVFGLA